MKLKLAGAAVLVVAASLAAHVPARAEVSIHVELGNAPPPPRIVFHREPHVVYVPESRVYIVDQDDCDYDTFHCGSYWYISNGGFWYRANSYRGPFRVIHERYVPAAIWRIPPTRWRHHPPGGFHGDMGGHDDVAMREKHGAEHEREYRHERGGRHEREGVHERERRHERESQHEHGHDKD